MQSAAPVSEAAPKAAGTAAAQPAAAPRRAKGAAAAGGSAERPKPRRRRSNAGLQAAALDDIRGDGRTLLARLEAEDSEAFDGYDDDEEEEHRAPPWRDPYGRSPGGGATPHRSVVLATRTAADAAEEAQIALALALSLSLCDAGDAPRREASGDSGGGVSDDAAWRDAGPSAGAPPHALSYEALVQLEDVRPVATSAEVDALPVGPFDAAAHGGADARCPICLDPLAGAGAGLDGADVEAALALRLPCGHVMHARCGHGYLLRWSKRCAEVHCRRSVRPCDADEISA